MSNTPTESEFDKKMKEILYEVWRNGRDGTDRYESVFNSLHDSKQAFDKHVIGEDEIEDIDLSKSAKSRWGVRARNRVRVEQRVNLYGGDEK